jgi:hypothetical protein
MKAVLGMVLGAALILTAVPPTTAEAGFSGYSKYRTGGGYYGMRTKRRGPQVRGYTARRGGYSYDPEDTINTYGNSRSVYGSTNSYRNYWIDRQTMSGPFDHGFFFDSGIEPNGGNSPYMN